MDSEFPLLLNIALIGLIFITVFLSEYSSLNYNMEAEFKIRSQKKVIGIFEVINALVWTGILVA